MTFALSEPLDFAQGAALILNYHTAYFALKLRGRLAEGERVLVHGAAGGVGTAALQVAKGLGATTVAVVSSDEKEQVARDAGADEVVRSDGPWREQAVELTGGGVDVVLDPVGGDRFTDSLRSLREDGRVVVVGFTGGSIPEVKVNRLLLRNTAVVGAGWGGYVMSKPELNGEIGAALDRMIADGTVRPVIGATLPACRGSRCHARHRRAARDRQSRARRSRLTYVGVATSRGRCSRSASTLRNASTTAGSNCAPAHPQSSESAASMLIVARYGRCEVIAS